MIVSRKDSLDLIALGRINGRDIIPNVVCCPWWVEGDFGKNFTEIAILPWPDCLDIAGPVGFDHRGWYIRASIDNKACIPRVVLKTDTIVNRVRDLATWGEANLLLLRTSVLDSDAVSEDGGEEGKEGEENGEGMHFGMMIDLN